MTKIKLLGLILAALLVTTAFTSKIDLEVKSLFNNRVELKVPKTFGIMGEDMMKVKYPSQNRPTLVYTNDPGTINVALNLTEYPATPEMMSQYTETFVQTFTGIYPTADWKDSGIKTINGKKVGYLELVTPAVDTEIYNLMFFTDLDGRLLICTFNCTKKNMAEWTPVAKEILASLRIK